MQEFSEEQLKQIILSLLPEVLSQYFQEKEKELKVISLLERLIRVEEELKALREEMKVRFEASDKRFESLLREMNARFEAMDGRFEAMDKRFEALDKRFNFMQWLIVVGFSFLAILITLFGFLKGQMKALILAGGSGTRLWPASRETSPQQFLKLNGKKFLPQQTIERILKILSPEDIALNTAPAIALQIRYCLERLNVEPSEVLLVCPSDHIIKPVEKFVEYVKLAEKVAKQGYLITFGINLFIQKQVMVI